MAEERCPSCFKERSGPSCGCGYPDKGQNENHQLPIRTMLRRRYQIGKVLGQGGYGITYLCWDTLMQKRVAVKEFFPEGTVYRKSDISPRVECVTARVVPHFEYARERFLREASALVKFQDIPEVVCIHDFVEENNTAYIVMEYVRGVDLAKYIRMKGGKLTPEETFRILKPVMEALAKIHKGGIVHRDISPDNIILEPMGGAKLLDFGAVRSVENPDVDKGLNKSTEAILKHGFAPIEQYNTRGSLGPWTDEYALCATVWYCLTGTIPEEASIRMGEGIDPDWSAIPGLPEHQQKALEKGFSCRARDRYPSVDALLEDLFPVEKEAAAPVQTIPLKAPEPNKEKAPKPPKEPRPKKEKAPKLQKEPKPKKEAAGNKKFILIPIVAAVILCVISVAVWAPWKGIFSQPDTQTGEEQPATEALSAEERQYLQAEQLLAEGRFQEAVDAFTALGEYGDSKDRIRECNYLWAEDLLARGEYQDAITKFSSTRNYNGSADKIPECYYLWGKALYDEGDHEGAIAKLGGARNHMNCNELIPECYYRWAEASLKNGELGKAAILFYKAGDHLDSRTRSLELWDKITVWDTVDAGEGHTVGLRSDGTVVAVGNNDFGRYDVSDWTDIVAISAGTYHTVGLKKDGTVVAAGYTSSKVSDWTDIVAISAGDSHTVGLKADGTVVAAGDGYYSGSCNVSNWTNIVAISAGTYHTVGLKADGTVVAAGDSVYNADGECDVSRWTDIVAISAGTDHTVGLKADGTVVATGSNALGQCDVSGWTDIVAISAGRSHTVGLKADGTVIIAGRDHIISAWSDIVAISAGYAYTVGLKANGTVVTAGSINGSYYVGFWRDIQVPKTRVPFR